MRENKRRSNGGYVSRHAAPEKSRKKKSSEDDYVREPYEEDELPEQDAYEQDSPEYEQPGGADGRDWDGEDDGGDDEQPDKPRKGRGRRKAGKKNKTPADDGLSDEERDRRREARRDRGRRVKITFIVLAVLVLLLGGAATAGGYMVTNSETIFPNVYVDGVAVGRMGKDAAVDAIKASGWEDRAAIALKARLLDTATFKIDRYKSGAMHTPEQAAAEAYAYGHDGNWYQNLIKYAKCLMVPVELSDSTISYNEAYIRSQCTMGIGKLNDALGDGGYTIDREKSVLRMIKGAGGLKFDLDDMVKSVCSALGGGQTALEYDYLASEPEMPDFQAIHTELSAEPADAYYTDDNTFTVVDDVEGCDFNVSDAENIWKNAANASAVEIPIKLTYPEVTGDELRARLFRDKLGAMTTYFKNSSDDRINNIKLASSKIDGLVLYPGDVFSYNETVGQRTEEAGFKMAGAYSNGEVVQELGGGICQVSSTLYSAMMYSYKLTTVQRSPHYFPVDYLEMGYDATVSWSKPDFKFRNDRDYPVKISAVVDEYERSLTIEIWGTNLDGTYIKLTKDTYSYNNDRYPWIMEGYGVQMHRLVFDANGMQIDQIDEIYDVYHTHEATDQIKALDAQAAAAGSSDGGLTLG